jgi:hypothetical protein
MAVKEELHSEHFRSEKKIGTQYRESSDEIPQYYWFLRGFPNTNRTSGMRKSFRCFKEQTFENSRMCIKT